jgi:hypothetical protein
MTTIYPLDAPLSALKDQMHDQWRPGQRDGYPTVPANHKDAIADYLTSVVAELVESYLDAGSERDAIAEEIFPHLLTLVNGWTEED